MTDENTSHQWKSLKFIQCGGEIIVKGKSRYPNYLIVELEPHRAFEIAIEILRGHARRLAEKARGGVTEDTIDIYLLGKLERLADDDDDATAD